MNVGVGLILSFSLLAATCVAWIYTIGLARRRRIMAARLSATVPEVTPALSSVARGPSIRLSRQSGNKLSKLGRLLKLPADVPLAHVIPPLLVFIIGIGVGTLSGWLLRFLLELPTSLMGGLLAGLLTIRALFSWEMSRYQTLLVKQLPDTIQLVVSATRAGLPISEAFRAIAQEMASPTRDEFIRVVNEMALGGAPDAALLAMHQRTGVPEYAIFAVTIGVQARSGGRLAETVQNLAETVRERLSIADRAKALASESKVSALIMGMLPLVSGFIMNFTQPKNMHMLFHDPRGIRMFAIGVITLLLGAITMRQLIKGVSQE